MARTTGRDAPEFTRSLTSLAALGAEFGIAPDADQGTEHPSEEVSGDTSSLAVTALPDTVHFDVVNIGGSTATMLGIGTVSVVFPPNWRLPPDIQLTGHHNTLLPIPLKVGERWEAQFPVEESHRHIGTSPLRREFFAMGKIRYADDNGIVRQLGFCRRYDFSSRRFDPTHDG